MKEGRLLVRERKTDFVRLFSSTPEGVVCPSFFVLSIGNGCPHDCAYCFLLNTLRRSDTNEVFSNVDKIIADVRRHFLLSEPSMLNAGELTDSLAWDQNRETVLKLIKEIRGQSTHTLLLVSKSDHIEEFMEIEPTQSVIFSFSINRGEVAKEYEMGSAEPRRRLAAAAFLQSKGWRIRLRIDPMIHHPDEEWAATLNGYSSLIEQIAKVVKPERITLGSLRAFQTLEYYVPKDALRIFAHLFDQGDPDRRKRYPFELRVKLYAAVIKAVKDKMGDVDVALCKETRKAWDVTRTFIDPSWLNPEDPKCNCSA